MESTIKDVARKANVSIATVSRYMNNPQIVSDKSREKITRAIHELEYVPNRVAKGLRMNQTQIVGLIVPDINNVYYSEVIQRAEEILEKNGYTSMLCTTRNSIEREKKYITTLFEQHVAGMIFIGTRQVDISNSEHLIDTANKIPVVLVNENSIRGNFVCIGNDEVYGSYLATKYLHGLGHTKIAFLTAKTPYRTYARKLEGYLKYLKEFGLPVKPEYIISSQGEYEDAGYESTRKLLRMKEPPTAVHTVNDQMALGVVWALNEAGYKVPEKFSVVGFSNIDTSRTVFPGITTVDQQGGRLGEMAADKLISAIANGNREYESILIEPKLVERNSCAQIKEENI